MPTPFLTIPDPLSVTNADDSIIISGTCGEGAVTVSWTGDDAGNQFCNLGSFSATINKTVDGIFEFDFIATNSEMVSTSPVTFTWTRDTSAPTPVVITSPAVSPYYSSGNSVNYSGTCETGATVQVSGAQSQSTTCSNGTFSLTINDTSDGNHTLNFSQTDAQGNSSTSIQKIWTRDTIAPAAPSVTSPTTSPHTSGDSTLTLSGTCEPNATIQWSGAASGSTPCSGGTFSFSVNQTADGTYDLTLIQKDQALNTSASTTQTWIRDTSIPASVVIQVPSGSFAHTNASSQVISGTCITGYDVSLAGDILATEVSVPNSSLIQTCSGGIFSFTVNKSVDGIYAIQVSQENTTNGLSSPPVLVEWDRDTVAPNPVSILSPSTNPFLAPDPLLIEGNCEDGSTVLLAGDAVMSTVCVG